MKHAQDKVISSRKKGGRGTHGSTTKAGKVRQQTPQIPKTVHHKSGSPRTNNRKKYLKRIVLEHRSGQEDWRNNNV